MKRGALSSLIILIILILSACSNDFGFKTEPAGISFTYDGNEYSYISAEDCKYQYAKEDMVHLCSLKEGEFSGMGESYNVYRHADDEAITYLFVIPKPSIRDMTPYALVLKKKDAPAETRAPGDFTLESIITGAERHMPGLTFTEIPAEELKQLYPEIVALPVEIRGRRAQDGTEYLVMASTDKRDIDQISDVQEILSGAAKARAEALGMEAVVTAGSYNKYGAVVCAKKAASDLMYVIGNTFTGQYLSD